MKNVVSAGLLCVITSLLFWAATGCQTLPPIDSSELIGRMTNAYGSCHTFSESGLITELEIEFGETNVSRINYQIEFVRGGPFRMELHSERQHGAGSYDLIYYYDGKSWSEYDTLNAQFPRSPLIKTNISVYGRGIALSYGLVPELPKLLHLDTNMFQGFRQFDRASVKHSRLDGNLVYRLTLEWSFWSDREVDDYWIDPRTFFALKQRTYEWKDRGKRIDTLTRESFRTPRLNPFPSTKEIKFNPPAQLTR
jgi:hypothetical protein